MYMGLKTFTGSTHFNFLELSSDIFILSVQMFSGIVCPF